MSKKEIHDSFDFNEFKNQIKQVKENAELSKKEYELKKSKGEIEKQPFWKKIVGIFILFAIIVGVVLIFISNFKMIFLPKNSITINVVDQNGNMVNGLIIQLQLGDETHELEFSESTSVTKIGATPGNYRLMFEKVPEGYTCPDIFDDFVLEQDGKVVLEYECTKE